MVTEELLRQLGNQVVSAMPDLTADDRSIALTLYRLLADGSPVDPGRVADQVHVAEAEVRTTLARWPGVFTDDDGRVVGFWGLALPQMPHRFEVGGRQLYTWCAWDALFLPPLLDRDATVTSSCPTTATTVRLRVTPTGITEAEPSSAMLSFLRPEEKFDADVVMAFCHFVHFFASPEAARPWIDDHPGTVVLSLDEGFRLGLLHPARAGDAGVASPLPAA